jgi:transposase
MSDVLVLFERWNLDVKAVRERMYRALTPRERERWHALWLLARGWSATQVAEALERDAHTVGNWVERFRQEGPAGLAFEQTGGPPPSSARRNKLS